MIFYCLHLLLAYCNKFEMLAIIQVFLQVRDIFKLILDFSK